MTARWGKMCGYTMSGSVPRGILPMKQVAGMEHESEGRIFEQIEHALTSDDPELAARMSTLNERFSEERAEDEGPAEEGRRADAGGRADAPPTPGRNWRRTTTLVLVVIALVGLLLTAVLNASSNEPPPSPSSPAAALSR